MSSSAPIDISQETAKSSSKQIPERTPGTTMLPLARIKRVIKEDKDVSLINAEATFCIAYATELFMEYLVTEAFSKAKKEKRKTVYYKDLASTVKESGQLEFLEDVIPTTMTLKDAMAKRKEDLNGDNTASSSAAAAAPPPTKKQKTNSNEKSDKTDTHNTNSATTSTESTTENTAHLSEEDQEEDEDDADNEEDDDVEQAQTQGEEDDEAHTTTEKTAVTAAQDSVDQDDTMMEEDPKQD